MTAMGFLCDKFSRVMGVWRTPEVNAHSAFKRCHVSSIVFNQKLGRGAKWVNHRASKSGFVVMMSPSNFLKLVGQKEEISEDNPYQHILRKGRSIASPYLYVDFDTPLPRIRGHRGHDRMNAILASERYGDMAVPVIIRPVGRIGLHNITEKLLTNLRGPVFTENGGIMSPTGIERIYIHGERKEMNDLLRKKQAAFEFTR